jgi:hypothetical protein
MNANGLLGLAFIRVFIVGGNGLTVSMTLASGKKTTGSTTGETCVTAGLKGMRIASSDVMNISGVYLSREQATAGLRALDREGFVARLEGGEEIPTGPPTPVEHDPPLDGMGLSVGVQGTEPVRPREDEDVPSSWVSGETTVVVSCGDEEAAEQVRALLDRTGARNVQLSASGSRPIHRIGESAD